MTDGGLGPEVRVRLGAGVRVREIAGEGVVVHLPSKQFFSFDVVAMRMWRALMVHGSVREAAAELVTEFEVEPRRLENDLLEFARECLEHGLLGRDELEGPGGDCRPEETSPGPSGSG